jgi:hypothetical protein
MNIVFRYLKIIAFAKIKVRKFSIYNTYEEFAVQYGHPDAIITIDDIDTFTERIKVFNDKVANSVIQQHGKPVAILAVGPHHDESKNLLCIVRCNDGTKFIMDRDELGKFDYEYNN